MKTLAQLMQEFNDEYKFDNEGTELLLNFNSFCIDCTKGEDERAMLLSTAGQLVTPSNFDSLFSIVHIVNRFYHETTVNSKGVDR